MAKHNGHWLFPVWAGVAAFAGMLGWRLGALDVSGLNAALPIAFGAFVPVLLVPLVLRGIVWIKSDAAAAAAGKGGATGVFLRR
ncbi:MAG: hypothetical protein AB7V40_02090 [Methyloceanibacter sp.]